MVSHDVVMSHDMVMNAKLLKMRVDNWMDVINAKIKDLKTFYCWILIAISALVLYLVICLYYHVILLQHLAVKVHMHKSN